MESRFNSRMTIPEDGSGLFAGWIAHRVYGDRHEFRLEYLGCAGPRRRTQELLPNAAALTWADPQHVMFSEIKRAPHGIAAAQESREKSVMSICRPT